MTRFKGMTGGQYIVVIGMFVVGLINWPLPTAVVAVALLILNHLKDLRESKRSNRGA